MQKNNFTNSGSQNFKKTVLSLFIPIALFVIFSIVFSFVCYLYEDPLSVIGIYSLAALLTSGAVSGIINAKIHHEKKILMSAFSAVITSIVLIIYGMVFSENALPAKSFMNVLCYFALTLFFTFIFSFDKKKGIKKHKRKR